MVDLERRTEQRTRTTYSQHSSSRALRERAFVKIHLPPLALIGSSHMGRMPSLKRW